MDKAKQKMSLTVKPMSRLQNRYLEKPVGVSQSIFIDSQRYGELPLLVADTKTQQ